MKISLTAGGVMHPRVLVAFAHPAQGMCRLDAPEHDGSNFGSMHTLMCFMAEPVAKRAELYNHMYIGSPTNEFFAVPVLTTNPN